MPSPEENVRGVKRKRPNDKGSEEDKEANLRRKLHQSLRELRRIVKKAKTFEVQRTLKKLKDARRKDPESNVAKDLGVQLEVLKHFSYDQLANSALSTKLKKDKMLSSSPSMRSIFAELSVNLLSPGEPGTPMAKVQSRILSSKALASEVVSIVEALRTLLQSVGSEDIAETADKAQPPPNRRAATGHKKDASSLIGDNIINTSIDGGYRNANEDETIAEIEDGWESGTVDDTGSVDLRVSDDATSDPESSDDEADVHSTGPSGKRPSYGSKGQSEFLPSLSVGFTRGDSGSEFNDSETELVDGIRKNRRGQRARRAIWEKKFGKNANHIKKSQQTIRGIRRRPDQVNADRRSFRLDRTPIPSRTRRETVWASGVENSGSTKERARPGDVRGMQGDRPSHPSWEAKRKQKAASIVPSQGTKIVFAES